MATGYQGVDRRKNVVMQFISDNIIFLLTLIFICGGIYFNISQMEEKIKTLEGVVYSNDKIYALRNEQFVKLETSLSFIKENVDEIRLDLKTLMKEVKSNTKEVAYYNAAK